ncbi:Ltp family lipoprotein, partial [Staphylococcus pseudintermedius]
FFLIVYFINFGGNSETETVSKESNNSKDLKEELKIVKAENKDLKSNIEEIENKNQNKTEKTTEEKTTEEPSTEEATTEEVETEEKESKSEDNPSREYKNALNSAKNYQEILPMSKAGLFDQLTSSAGDNYPEDAAQYAIDNLKADYKENALKAAENYQDIMPMSDSELFDQLTSDAGDKYTHEEAQYAIDNLD